MLRFCEFSAWLITAQRCSCEVALANDKREREREFEQCAHGPSVYVPRVCSCRCTPTRESRPSPWPSWTSRRPSTWPACLSSLSAPDSVLAPRAASSGVSLACMRPAHAAPLCPPTHPEGRRCRAQTSLKRLRVRLRCACAVRTPLMRFCPVLSGRQTQGHLHGIRSLDALPAQRRQQEAHHDLARRAGVHAAVTTSIHPAPLVALFWHLASVHMHCSLLQCVHVCVHAWGSTRAAPLRPAACWWQLCARCLRPQLPPFPGAY